MSFFYPSSTASTRSRRTRDKDGTGRASSISSHRRSKDYSKPREERSPPPPKPSTPSTLASSMYTQKNLAIEQLPDPPTGVPGSPTTATSPVLKPGFVAPNTTGVYSLPFQIHTPAALQSYLESADEDDSEEEEDGSDDEDDVNEADSASAHTLGGSGKNSQDKPAESPKSPTTVEKTSIKNETPLKIEDKIKNTTQEVQDEVTPKPKAPSSVTSSQSSQDGQKMPGQFPFPQDDFMSQQTQQRERPKMSASSISLQELSRQPRDSPILPSSSPNMLSRSTSNIDAPLPSLHERAFTPPAPAQGIIPNRGSPAFISPLPVRPTFVNHHVPSYQSQHPVHISPQMHHQELHQAPAPMSYYVHQQSQRPPLAYLGGRNPSSSETIVWDQAQQHQQQQQQQQYPQVPPPQSLEQYYQPQHHSRHSYSQSQDLSSSFHLQQQLQVQPTLPSPEPSEPQEPSPQLSPKEKYVEPTTERSQSPEDEHVLMLRRIQAVMPDFHALLNCYNTASGRLSIEPSKENFNLGKEEKKEIKLLEHSKETSDDKDREIEILMKELNIIEKEQATERNEHFMERNKMRLVIGNLEEEKRLLAEDTARYLSEYEVVKKDEQSLREQLDSYSTKATQDKNMLESKIASLESQLNEKTRAELSYTTSLMAKDDAAKKDINRLSAQLSDEKQRHEETVAKLTAQISEEKRRAEDQIGRLRSEHTNALQTREAELEKAKRSHVDAGDVWKKERDTLTTNLEKECREIKTQWEEHCRKLSNQHIKEREELQKSWETSQQKQLKRNDQLEDDRDKLRREVDKLKSAWSADRSKYSKTADEFRSMAMRLQNEHLTIQKMMESMGEAAEESRHHHRRHS